MLELSHLVKTFHPGTVNERRAIRDLSLTVPEGQFVTVIGGNGAGKSTLLNLISGALFPDSGSVRLDGQDVTFQPEFKRAKAFAAASSRKNEAFFREKLRSLDLGLEDRLKTRVGLLSGGQRQALTLLMATVATPRLLLLDEHTAALDPVTADKVLALTDRIVRENRITTLMITHNMASALALGDRTLMLEQGEILLDVSGEERASMTVDALLERFQHQSGAQLVNDRLLLNRG